MSKPGARQKPKPPPYPRPIPQFVVEEIPPQPVDIAWNAVNGGEYYSDDDDSIKDGIVLEQRAAKRRRIEACATAYLRGEPVYIMSAQLKGPFKEGWQNPWAKRRRIQKAIGPVKERTVEIPETARKIPCSVEEERVIRKRVATPEPRPAVTNGLVREAETRTMRLEQAPSPFTSRVQKVPDEISPKVPQHIKEKLVKDWLRTNDAFAKTSDILVHSSPTPASRARKTPTHSQEYGSIPKASQSEPPIRVSFIASPIKTAQSLQPQHARKLSSAQKRVQGLSRDMQNMLAEPIVQTSIDLQDEVSRLVHPVSSSGRLADSSRAEFAILKARRSDLQTAPANAHMSPFEFRKLPGKNRQKGPEQLAQPLIGNERPLHLPAAVNDRTVETLSGQIDVQNPGIEANTPMTEASGTMKATDEDVFATAPQPDAENTMSVAQNNIVQPINVSTKPVEDQTEQAPALNVSRPALSAAVSEISITDLLPSAQPRLEPQPSVSSAINEKMLSIKPTTSVSERTEAQIDARDDRKMDGQTSNTDHPDSDGAPEVPIDLEVTPRTNGDQSNSVMRPNVADLSTQEMLANIEPLELSTIKRPKAFTKKDTPTTATRTRSERKRKKASFAADPSGTPSHGSIKDVMKAKVSKQLASPPLFLFSKNDLDIEISDDENASQLGRLKQLSSAGKPKSILKSTNPASSPTSLRKSKSMFSTGQEQDGQQRNLKSIQNGVADDNFDLDAAIDDLGSFLGTWDAEKEASSLDIEL